MSKEPGTETFIGERERERVSEWEGGRELDG